MSESYKGSRFIGPHAGSGVGITLQNTLFSGFLNTTASARAVFLAGPNIIDENGVAGNGITMQALGSVVYPIKCQHLKTTASGQSIIGFFD